MCLAIPSKIVEKDGLTATVDVCGARRQVNLMLLPEEASVGEFVLVHAGFAMQKVDTAVAEESLKFFGGLVDAERKGEASSGEDGEMAEVLQRGTIRWNKSSRGEPESGR